MNRKTEIVEQDGKRFVIIPSKEQAQQRVLSARKKAAEIPVDRSTPIAAVIAYELYGMSPEEIAIATGWSVPQINSMRESPAYEQIKGAIVNQIVEKGQNDVKEIFVQKRTAAATKITELIDNPRPNVALKASEMVLKASGYEMETKHVDPASQLTIVYIDKTEPNATIQIDQEFPS